jgi:hypothetical protein
MRWLAGTLLLLCAGSGWMAGQDQGAPRVSQGRVVTKTRLVAMFSDLENQLLQAEQAKDEGTLNRLLGEEFQVWTPEPPGDPIPKEDWQKRALTQKLLSFRVEQMTVRGLSDEIAVASFVLWEKLEQRGKENSSTHFVVDVWKKNGDSWQITDRYQSRVAHSASTESSLKPTGKE